MEEQIWTPEADEKLFALHAEGLSFSQIGKILGRSKNACVGRHGRQRKLRERNCQTVYRVAAAKLSDDEIKRIFELRKSGMGTPAIAKALGRSQKSILNRIKARTAEFSVRDKTVSILPVIEYKSKKKETYQTFSDSGGVTLMELQSSHCRWPVGDPRAEEFRFCGAHAPIGQTYCCQHHAIAYYRAPTTVKERRDAERSHNRALAGGLR